MNVEVALVLVALTVAFNAGVVWYSFVQANGERNRLERQILELTRHVRRFHGDP